MNNASPLSPPVAETLPDRIARIADDPLPPPVIRVGGIGRRKLPRDTLAALSVSVQAILASIRSAAADQLLRTEVRSQFSGHLSLRSVSPLADGADRLIARAALEEGYHLGAILPFERAAYEATFGLGVDIDPVTSRREFDELVNLAASSGGYGVFTMDGLYDTERRRNRSFEHCGSAVLWWSDIVIAIVEREDRTTLDIHLSEALEMHPDEPPKPSQTILTVLEAAKLGIPVIIIDAAQPDKPELLFSEVGTPKAGGDRKRPFDEGLAATVAAILGTYDVAFVKRLAGKPEGWVADYIRHPTKLIADFRQKTAEASGRFYDYDGQNVSSAGEATVDLEYGGPYKCRTGTPGWYRIWGWISPLLAAFARAYAAGAAHRARRRAARRHPDSAAEPDYGIGTPKLADLVAGTACEVPFQEYWLYLHRADKVADANAALHRSVQLLLPTLMLFSVLVSVTRLTFHIERPGFGIFELVFLFVALTLMFAARQYRWMQNWLASRLLAETLRYSKFLLVTGRVAPFREIMRLHAPARMRHNWVRSYARHVLRAQPLAVPGRGLSPDPEATQKIAAYILDHCLHDQSGYHHRNIGRHLALERLLSRVGTVLSVATVLVAVVEFVRYFLLAEYDIVMAGKHATATIETFGILLPALTATVLSWRTVGEHDAVAKRSEAMEKYLEQAHAEIAAAAKSEYFTIERLGGMVVPVVHRLLQDVDNWAELFTDKETSIA